MERQMTHGSLFSGIGGFDIAADWMGWENVFHCEWNEFGQRVLKHYWPNAESFNDITKTDFRKYANRIDILTGGFPCQPYSQAGKRLGKEDDRHLWPEMLRAIREVQPRWVVGENVLGIVNWSGGMVFEEVQADLEAAGYEVQPVILPACGVNAPHRRERVWFVAYCNSNGQHGGNCEHEKHTSKRGFDALNDVNEAIMHTNNKGLEGFQDKGETERKREGEQQFASRPVCPGFQNFPTQSPICGGDDGLPSRLDGITFSKWRQESIKAYGNAIVPQIAYEIFKAIATTTPR
jgi:DNA (cytosine-5)-methyltransferase 1